MTTSITLNANYLKSLRHIMARKEVRYYLCGVAVQCNPAGKFMIATDGHRMGVYRQPWPDNEEQQLVDLIIPGDVVRAFKPFRGVSETGLRERDGGQWQLGDILFTPIDGKFPDWHRVFPAEVSGEPGDFNWDYMADFQALAREGWNSRIAVELYQNGSSAALVKNGCPDFCGVLMPLRVKGDNSEGKAPEWICGPFVAPGIPASEATIPA